MDLYHIAQHSQTKLESEAWAVARWGRLGD